MRRINNRYVTFFGAFAPSQLGSGALKAAMKLADHCFPLDRPLLPAGRVTFVRRATVRPDLPAP